ncbi:MAG: hypothetical protein PHF86_12785 [Candidatus Nanoarchaeia archaeon]|nr:hypothetical protein [Candidatus Nanoarchaeia archaeon]
MKTRSIIENVLISGMIVLASLRGIEYYHQIKEVQKFRNEQIANFGTIEQPKYLITAKFNQVQNRNENKPFKIRYNYDGSNNINLEINYKNFKKYCNTSFLDSETPSDSLFLINKKLIEKNCNTNFINMYKNEIKKIKNSKLNEIEISKQIFEDLTNKKFPEFIRINKEKMDNREGYHFAYGKKIAFKDIFPLMNISTILHEMGHMIVQYDEQNDSDESILEEACADAFANAGLEYLISNQDNVKELEDYNTLFKYITNLQEQNFKEGKDDKAKHYAGATLFNETLKIIKDPYETFNYLATVGSLENLKPEIKVAMKIK